MSTSMRERRRHSAIVNKLVGRRDDSAFTYTTFYTAEGTSDGHGTRILSHS